MATTLNTKELQEKLNSYQTGITPTEVPDIPQFNDEPQAGIEPVGDIPPGKAQQQQQEQKPSLRQMLREGMLSQNATREYTQEALQAGFGESKYDTEYRPGMDLESNRAAEQSGGRKILFGVGKMGITAGSTYLNTTLGVLNGLGTGIFAAAKGLTDRAFDKFVLGNEHESNKTVLGEALNAGANNWISGQLQKIQEMSDNWMPNYRTERERSDEYQEEWWPHFGNANWIGDSFLRNFGFTLGAIGGGATVSKGLSTFLLRPKYANKVLKGAVLAANGDEEALKGLQRVSEAIKSGTAIAVDDQKLLTNIKDIAERINKADARLQLFATAFSSLGEGDFEGLSARKEFLDDYTQKIQEEYARRYSNIENDILASGDTRFVTEITVPDMYGNQQTIPVLNENGKAELLRRQKEMTEHYRKLDDYAHKQADTLAAVVMALNQAVLFPSDLVQFGKVFSGGWKTSRKQLSGLAGGIERTVTGDIKGVFRNTYNKTLNTIGKSAKVAAAEASEELSQGMISAGTKKVGDYRISSYNDLGYDDEAVYDAFKWFSNFGKGATEYITDKKNWQEGMLGALTGILGIPGRRWKGGAIGAAREARDEYDAAQNAAQRLNELVNKEEFKTRWKGFIRDRVYDRQKLEALMKDDEYAWHNAEYAQVINDVVTFAAAGRLDDLEGIIDIYASLPADRASEVREMTSKENTGEEQAMTRNLDNENVAAKVRRQAQQMKDVIHDYRDIYDALAARADHGTSQAFLEEMVSTALTIKANERRFLQLFNEVFDGTYDENGKPITIGLDEIIRSFSRYDKDGNPLDPESEQVVTQVKNLKERFEKLFGGTMPIKLTAAFQREVREGLEAVKEIAAKADPEFSKKLDDLIKLAESRQEYFYKLQTLQDPNGFSQFEEEAKTVERQEQKMEQKAIQQQASDLKTIDDVRKKYAEEKSKKNDANFINDLRKVRKVKGNEHINDFLNIYYYTRGLKDYLKKKFKISDSKIKNDHIDFLIDDLFNKAKSEKEITDLASNDSNDLFSSYQDFMQIFNTYGVDPSTYPNAKKELRRLIQEYIQEKTAVVNGGKISSTTPGNPNDPADVSDPTGADAPTPGTVTPPPAAAGAKTSLTVQEFRNLARAVITTNTFDEDVGKPGYEEVARWLNPILLNDPSYNATSGVVEAALKYPDLKISKHILALCPGVSVQPNSSQPLRLRRAVSLNITDKDVADDMTNSAEDIESADDLDEQDHIAEDYTEEEKIAFYRTSVPDIVTRIFWKKEGEENIASAQEYRDAMNYYKRVLADPNASTSDVADAKKAVESLSFKPFIETNPEYTDIWNALQRLGASKNLNVKAKVGDIVMFQIRPGIEYEGEPQILVAIDDGSENGAVFTVLSRQSDKYYNLKKCRDAIMAEYNEWAKTHNKESEIFTFSEKSKIFAKQKGFVPYRRTDDKESNNSEIKSIPGYDKNTPIVYINRSGNAVPVNGKPFDSSTLNTRTLSKGGIYYLSPGTNGTYVPIRVSAKHFNDQSLRDAAFAPVIDIINKIAELSAQTTKDNIPEQNEKLRELMKEFRQVLDIHDLYLELGEYNDIVSNEEKRFNEAIGQHSKGLGLLIATKIKDEEEDNKKDINEDQEDIDNIDDDLKKSWNRVNQFLRIDQMTGDRLVSLFLDMNKPLALNEDASTGRLIVKGDDFGGMFMSNAVAMHTQGSDVWFYPWNEESGSFEPATVFQEDSENEMEEAEKAREADEDSEIYLGDDITTEDDDISIDDDYYTDPFYEPDQSEQTEEEPAMQTKNDTAIRNALTDMVSNAGIKVFTDNERALNIIAAYKTSGRLPNGFRALKTMDGDEIYGFVTDKGEVFIDANAPADTPLHEYTHLWADAYRSRNPEAWNKIIKKIKGTSIWEKVKNAYPELKTDDQIADEVIAFYSGARGLKRIKDELNRLKANNELEGSKKMRAIKALNNLKQALEMFWRGISDLLGLKYASAASMADAVLSDLLHGVNPTAKESIEIKNIKERAIANGTFMKAPNGKPTNLTEKQWLQVRTKAFKNWFGDWENDPKNASKVVDGNGEPLIVYHGTMEPGFSTFEQQEWQFRKGFYFTEKKANAEAYGDIYVVFLNIRKPKVYDFKGNKWNNSPITGIKSTDDAVNKTDENVNDATIIKNVIDSGGVSAGADNDYIVFNSNQIKSATDNSGAFSTEDNNIYSRKKSLGVQVTPQDARKMLDSYNIDRASDEMAKIADKVFAVAESLGLSISVVPGSAFVRGIQGRYNRNGIIEYSADYLNSKKVSSEKKANLILHEMIHAVTSYAIDAYERGDKELSEDLKAAVMTFNDVFQAIQNDKRFDGMQGTKSVREMVAELGSPEFRLQLKRTGLWSKIIDGIKRLFGIKNDEAVVSNALTELDRALERTLTAFDTRLYNKFTRGESRELDEKSEFETSETDPASQFDFDVARHNIASMAELDSESRNDLKKKGYDEDEFDAMPDKMKDRVADCAGVL